MEGNLNQRLRYGTRYGEREPSGSVDAENGANGDCYAETEALRKELQAVKIRKKTRAGMLRRGMPTLHRKRITQL